MATSIHDRGVGAIDLNRRGRFGEPPLPRNDRMGSRELFQKAQVILREEPDIRNFE
jgi:hypothetical protein